MRPLRQIPQLPQTGVNCSNPGGADPFIRVSIHLGSSGVPQPFGNFLMAETPLAPDLHSRNHIALGPQANGPGGNTEPSCDRRGCE